MHALEKYGAAEKAVLVRDCFPILRREQARQGERGQRGVKYSAFLEPLPATREAGRWDRFELGSSVVVFAFFESLV